MIQFNVQDISEYRGQLMGIATLLVIFGHSVGNGVAMPRWMESLCGLSSVGVDIFLLVSGLGLWYSLTSLNGNNVQQGVRCWYLRRYKRILIPYLIIIGFHYTLSVLHGMPISQALFELSTLSYWVNHQGAWFIAMLIPVYALTPLHYRIYNKVKSPVLYSSLLNRFHVSTFCKDRQEDLILLDEYFASCTCSNNESHAVWILAGIFGVTFRCGMLSDF